MAEYKPRPCEKCKGYLTNTKKCPFAEDDCWAHTEPLPELHGSIEEAGHSI